MNPQTAGQPIEANDVPAKCPSCGSRDVITASKVINSSSYWRCGGCGEVWNIARQAEGSRYAHRRPFGR